MKYTCECGHIIVDQTDYLPYKARIIRDQQAEQLVEDAVKSIVSWMNAVSKNREEQWLKEQGFGRESLPDTESIAAMICWQLYKGPRIYQCEACGRLFITRADADGKINRWVMFKPEHEDSKNVLASEPA